MAKEDKALEVRVAEPEKLKVDSAPFEVSAGMAASLSLRPDDFPLIGLSAIQKKPGAKSGKVYFASAKAGALVELVQKVKAG